MHPSPHFPSRLLPALAMASLLGAALTLVPEQAHGRPAVPAADGPSDLQYLSQVGGSLIDIAATNAVDDKRLFVAMGARIEVYDVQDAGSPRRLGESAPLPSNATHLDEDGGPLGAARSVRGLAFAGDRLYAYLSPPRGTDQPREIGRFIAGLATLRSIAILPDGGLRPLGDLDLATNLNTGAAHRPVVDGAYVAVSGGPVGVALARRASGRGVFPDVLVPLRACTSRRGATGSWPSA